MSNNLELSKDATIEEVANTIIHYMKENSLSYSSMAKHLNWNRSTLSQFVTFKYQGNNDALRIKAIEFFNMNIELPETPDELFVETAQSKSVFTVCRFAQRKGLLALLIGPAGVGKTTALEAYARSNSQTIMVTAFPGIPPVCMLKRITAKLKYESGGDDATMIDNLINRLKGKNILLIIDEGHYVKLNILEQIRHIQDMTGVGIVLSGNFGLHEQMKGKEQVKYAHLSSRAAMKVRIDGSPIRDELVKMMEKRELPTDRVSVDFMIKKAEKPGHFRILRNISELATEIAGLEGVPVAISHLREAEKLIME